MSLQENEVPNRLSAFKHKGKDLEEMRRRRTSATIELRKTSRFDQMLKKRNIDVHDTVSPLQECNYSSPTPTKMTIPEIMSAITSGDENFVFEALQDARKILSKERNPPIQDIIKSGIVPHLVEFLSSNYSEKFQFEACWALTNIASGNSQETGVIVKAGALPKFLKLLESPYINVAEQATWTLGNIAGDGPEFRDMILDQGGLPMLLKLLESDVPIITVRTIAWTISNLCRNKNPYPPFHIVKTCLPSIVNLLIKCQDKEVQGDICWSLSYLTDGSDDRIQAVIDTGVVPSLVKLLSAGFESDNCQVLTPALRTIGNIVTGNEEQTECVINAGALPKLLILLNSKKINIAKEAAWTISNITAGNILQIQAVIDAGILPALISVMESGDFKSQKEAAWAVSNFASGATIQQLSILLQLGVLPPLCNLLNTKDGKITSVILSALDQILEKAEKIGELTRVAIMIEECGGLDKIENLQNHENQQVYEKALTLIQRFFMGDDEEGVVATESLNGQFTFKPQEHTSHFNF